MLLRPLPSGPLDVIGDVHGWLEPLRCLLRELGYDDAGGHPDGRLLVFVGDLVDRGPDSEGVCHLVSALEGAGRARVVAGNHELNLLRRRRHHAHGNEWFFAAPSELQENLLAWMDGLPLALEREDLRVVHACWDARAVTALAREPSLLEAFQRHESRLQESVALEQDRQQRELLRQNENPVKVLTSGLEEPSAEPYEAGGRQRVTRRRRWWEDYDGGAAVVFGHYWRSWSGVPVHASGFHYLFEALDPLAPLGPGQAAWCIDYSIGVAADQPGAALAALRWPEGELVAVRGDGSRIRD